MQLEQILMLVTPIVVWGVTELLKKVLPILSGWGIVLFIVPIIGALASWVVTLITPESAFWTQFLISLLAVFLNEIKRQLTPKS